MIVPEKIEYRDSETTYEGVLAYNNRAKTKLPVILISHAYGGQSKFEETKAKELLI